MSEDDMFTLERYRRVFIYTGQVSHLIDKTAPPLPGEGDQPSAICGVRPMWPAKWFDESSDLSIGRILCSDCQTRKEGL